jgi:hypothetical protein
MSTVVSKSRVLIEEEKKIRKFRRLARTESSRYDVFGFAISCSIVFFSSSG